MARQLAILLMVPGRWQRARANIRLRRLSRWTATNDAVRDASLKPDSNERLAAQIVRRVATRDRSERRRG
jgi:hypothetical protein